MLLLAIDTSFDKVSVALLESQKKYIFFEEVIERGQGEILIPTIQKLFEKTSHNPSDLTDIAVSIGPGSFTGVRIGIATARAMGMSLNIPVHGVTNFEVYTYHIKQPITVVLDSKRSDFFVQKFDNKGLPLTLPCLQNISQLKNNLPFTAIGSGAEQLQQKIGCEIIKTDIPTSVIIGKIALTRLNQQIPAIPLYLREADVTV